MMLILHSTYRSNIIWGGRRLIGLLLCVLAVIAFAPSGHTQAVPIASAVASGLAPYRLMTEDVVEITVLDHAELDRTVTLPPDGRIDFPFAGEFQATGMTAGEIGHRIADALGTQLSHPHVIVTLRSLHPRPAAQVSVLGAVHLPGKRPFLPGWRLLDLLVDCAGITALHPEQTQATLVHAAGDAQDVDLARLLIHGDSHANLALLPGDVLLVSAVETARFQVQVLGEVLHPGGVPFPEDGSLLTALDAAGGPTPHAALTLAFIRHDGRKQPIDLSGLVTGAKVGQELRLQPGDMVFLPRNHLAYAVLGAVNHPGYTDYPESGSVTLFWALSLAGGPTAEANLRGVTLMRAARGGAPGQTVSLNLEEALHRGDRSKDVTLGAGDLVYVPVRTKRGGASLRGLLDVLPLLNLLKL